MVRGQIMTWGRATLCARDNVYSISWWITDHIFAKYFVVQSLGKYAVPCIKSLSFNNICTFNSSHAFQHYVFLIINNIFVQYFLLDGVCAIFKQVLKSLQRDVCPRVKRGGGWWGLMGGGWWWWWWCWGRSGDPFWESTSQPAHLSPPHFVTFSPGQGLILSMNSVVVILPSIDKR